MSKRQRPTKQNWKHLQALETAAYQPDRLNVHEVAALLQEVEQLRKEQPTTSESEKARAEAMQHELDKDEQVAELEMEDDSLYEESWKTWGEFKKDVEAVGVTDDMEVGYIDWPSLTSEVQVVINKDRKSFHVW